MYEFHSNESTDPNKIIFHSLGHWRVAPGLHDVIPIMKKIGYFKSTANWDNADIEIVSHNERSKIMAQTNSSSVLIGILHL